MSTSITVTGFVATQPKYLVTSKNIPIVSFRLGVSERRYDAATKAWVNGDTSWLSVSAFRYLAQNAAKSVQKGERVIVTGRLRVREWQAGEKSGIDVELDAESIGHDLNWGVTRLERPVREAAAAGEAEPATAGGEQGAAVGGMDASGWASPGLDAIPPGFSASPADADAGAAGAAVAQGFSAVFEPERELESAPY